LAILLPALSLAACGSSEPPPPVGAAAAALPHCQPYAPEQVLRMDLPSQLIWIDEEIRRCQKPPAEKAADYLLRGSIRMELPGSGPELAIEDFGEAIALRPDDARAYAGRAAAKILLKRYADALADANRAIELAPDAAAYGSRARIYQALGDPETALADYERAIALAPGRANTWRSRGLLYGRLGRVDAAVADIRHSIELDPPQALAWQGALAELGYYDGPQNGAFDSATEAALRQWIAAGMPGLASDATLTRQ